MIEGKKDTLISVLDIRGFSTSARYLVSEKVRTFLNRFSSLVRRSFKEDLPEGLIQNKLAEINQFTGDGFLLFFYKDEHEITKISYEDYEIIILKYLLKLKNEYNLLKNTPDYEDFKNTALGASVVKGTLYYDYFLTIGFEGFEERKIYTGVGYDVNKAFRLCDISQGGKS